MEHQCIQEDRIRRLEALQTENGVCLKYIRDDIAEIKADLKTIHEIKHDDNGSNWTPIVIKALELAGTAIMVAGAIYGALKLSGK